ncbi:porin family protein [Phocaeicola plebeius]|jgi:opacity protein-like surface antigen|uniref:porin family protein n=1 Tax=Phocaeicola plebeius TaxID=310297 RepID=UPI0022E15C49|nr:porin family protein [Phocaeicola plebeius]
MKKLLSTLMVIACLALAIPAQAQIKFGVKAGLNVSKLHLSKETLSSDNRAGFFIGPTAEFTLPLLGLGIDGSVLYNQFGVDSEKGTSTKKSIEIPINLRWTVGFSSLVGAYVAVGPQFGFNVGDRWFDEVCEFKKNTTSFNVGAGLKLLGHLQVGANYNFALKDNGKIHDDDIEDLATIGFKQNTWQVSVAYLF